MFQQIRQINDTAGKRKLIAQQLVQTIIYREKIMEHKWTGDKPSNEDNDHGSTE